MDIKNSSFVDVLELAFDCKQQKPPVANLSKKKQRGRISKSFQSLQGVGKKEAPDRVGFGQSFCDGPPHTDYPGRFCFTLEESKSLWKDSVGHTLVIPDHARGQWGRGSIWPRSAVKRVRALLLMHVVPFKPKNVGCLIVKMINFYYSKVIEEKVLLLSFLLMCSYLITHFPYSHTISELTKFIKNIYIRCPDLISHHRGQKFRRSTIFYHLLFIYILKT